MNTQVSFEPSEPAGVLTGDAQITDSYIADSGTFVLQLHAHRRNSPAPTTASSSWSRDFTVTPGTPCPVKFKLSNGSTDVRLVLTITDGAAVTIVNLLAPLGPGWVLWEATTFTPTNATVNIKLETPVPPGPVSGLGKTGNWLVDSGQVGPDDVVVIPEEEDMALDREPIYEALLARLQEVPGFVTCTRDFRHWDDCPSELQPALYMTVGDQDPENKLGTQPTWLIEPTVFLYFRRNEEGQIVGTQINAALKAIEEALEWRSSDLAGSTQFGMNRRHQTTLGGLVQYAWMTPIVTVEAVSQQQAVVKFGIEMRAAAMPAAA